MSIIEFPIPQSKPPIQQGFKTMFAIAYDFDTEKLKKNYRNSSYNNAYAEVRKFLEPHGFTSQQGSVLYGNDTVTYTKAFVAIVELSKAYPWLKDSLSDIRILQLMNNDDLMPIVEMGHNLSNSNKDSEMLKTA